MRSALTGSVNSLILVVVAMGMWFQAARAEGGPVASPGPSLAEEPEHEFDRVEGRGRSRKEAQRDAVGKAQVIIVKHLRRLEPPVEWTPPGSFIRDRLLGKPQHEEAKDETVEGVHVECWSWPLAINSKTWQAIQEADRKERVERRMILLAKLLAGLVALLGVVAGYVRLDEYTKGYYTGWLRAGALGALAVVGAGLWLLA